MKKKIMIISLLASISVVSMATASARVSATLDVVDPTTEVSLNISSTAMSFGDTLIAAGKVQSTPIKISLDGTASKLTNLTIPEKIELKTTTGATIDLSTKLTSTDGTITTSAGNHIFSSNLPNGKASADLTANLDLLGTEISGLYTGTIALSAAYN